MARSTLFLHGDVRLRLHPFLIKTMQFRLPWIRAWDHHRFLWYIIAFYILGNTSAASASAPALSPNTRCSSIQTVKSVEPSAACTKFFLIGGLQTLSLSPSFQMSSNKLTAFSCMRPRLIWVFFLVRSSNQIESLLSIFFNHLSSLTSYLDIRVLRHFLAFLQDLVCIL